jgi:RNA 2'-phosphotransferase, Tpt1 / KptA family
MRYIGKKTPNVWLDENAVKFGRAANRVLRHRSPNLDIRPDGYVRVQDLVCSKF